MEAQHENLDKRLGLFFEWAEQLQAEFRDLRQRVGALESSAQSEELAKRLQAVKKNCI